MKKAPLSVQERKLRLRYLCSKHTTEVYSIPLDSI